MLPTPPASASIAMTPPPLLPTQPSSLISSSLAALPREPNVPPAAASLSEKEEAQEKFTQEESREEESEESREVNAWLSQNIDQSGMLYSSNLIKLSSQLSGSIELVGAKKREFAKELAGKLNRSLCFNHELERKVAFGFLKENVAEGYPLLDRIYRGIFLCKSPQEKDRVYEQELATIKTALFQKYLVQAEQQLITSERQRARP
jgi:hypothetical protein